MSDSILDEVREILQKSPTTSFGQGYVIGLVAELEATQGVLSRVQEARVDDIARAEKAEAENARLTKMVDWLAELVFDRPCAYACCPFDKHRPTGPDDDDCDKTHIQCWAEAARRAVAAGEETCQK